MIKPISKKKYYETISEQISQAILSGEWPEGSRVPTEDVLANIFAVGRGSIREAITNLQMAGILVSSPGVGTYVSDNAISCINNSQLADLLNDSDNLNDMLKTRLMLEPQMAADAAENASAESITRLQKALDQVKDGKGDKWAETGHLFHLALAEISGNKILNTLFKSIEERTRKSLGTEAPSAKKKTQTIEAYQSVMDAIEQKKPELAEKQMKEMLRKEFGI